MDIGTRLRCLRLEKRLTQGDIEKRSGLLRPQISRLEHGHTVPTLETLEKLARALEVPIYGFFLVGRPQRVLRSSVAVRVDPSLDKRDKRFLRKLQTLVRRMRESDRRLFLHVAQKMAGRSKT